MLARPAHCALCSSEGIYENTPLKSGAMPAPSTAPDPAPAVLGKYEFGLGQEIRGEDSEQDEEEEEEEGDTRGQEAVSFQVDISSTVAFITN